MPRKPTLSFRKLGRQKVHGYQRGDQLVVDERLKGKKKLETIIHEWMHWKIAHWDERTITHVSEELCSFLWQHGTRLVEPDVSKVDWEES